MKETMISSSQTEDYPEPVSEENKILPTREKTLGEILEKYPNIQSNSPELYLLGYLKNLGSRKI